MVGLGLALSACSPLYVIKAGLAEARILRARRPIPDVILDPATTPATRDKLTLAREAQRFGTGVLAMRAGRSYTSYAQLDRDTLALVLSAAPQDRLEPRTWWFPIIGRVPYRGFFDMDDALSEQRKLEREGFDTLLRPTAAFSTLGWFDDPLLSSTLRQDVVGVVDVLLHEMAHTHLFVPGHVRFNESYATFSGAVGAARFFCTRPGGGTDTVKCRRARARWEDTKRFSAFLDPVVDALEELYADAALSRAEKISQREVVFERAVVSFREDVQPRMEVLSFAGFATDPVNNATILSDMRYYHRLQDFQELLDSLGGDLTGSLSYLREEAGSGGDPYAALHRP